MLWFKEPDDHYYEVLRELNEHGVDMTPKTKRKIHRELRKYGDGVVFRERYPDLPIWFSLATLLILIIFGR